VVEFASPFREEVHQMVPDTARTVWMVGVVLLLAGFPGAPALADAVQQDFSRTPFKLGVHDALPRPQRLSEETAHARFLRLAWSRLNNHNSLSFQRSDAGLACAVTAEFDFRIRPGSGRADGLGFALLDTGEHGVSGVVAPSGIAEEPNFPASLGIGFDIYHSGPLPPQPDDLNDNHVSVHFDGDTVAQFDAGPNLDLGSGNWIHAAITVKAADGSVSIVLTEGATTTELATDLPVPGLAPYESRAWFGARTGGENADFDLDNVAVVFTPCPPPVTLGRLP
jgi:hypothetical protein